MSRGRRIGWGVRTLLLTLGLGVTAMAVPDSQVAPQELSLTKVTSASATDLTPRTVWVLAIGSDARPGEAMTRARGDAIQLVGMNTRSGAATSIGIPRDSWVPIPGRGSEKINSALYLGGPPLMAQAVGNLVGIQPDYVMVTRFPFFEDMVDAIGGIEVRNPRAFSDPHLYTAGFKTGKIHLNGYGAMAFSRVRKSLPGGDFDRSANQQRTLRGIHAKVAAHADQPGFLARGVLSVLKFTDTNARPSDLFALARAVSQVKAGKISTCVVPGSLGNVGPQSVVFPNVAKARQYGADARHDATIKRC